MFKQFLIGIDIGTTGCKIGLFSTDGKIIQKAYHEYGTIFMNNGWAEEIPQVWWEDICSGIHDVLHESGIDSTLIAGLSISCTNALIPVDRNGNPLHNAIMQMDNRSQEQVDKIVQIFGDEKLLDIASNRAAPGTCWAPVILWLKENRTDIYNKIYKFLSPTGFIVQKLTGKFTIDFSRASTTLLFDVKNCCWSTEICNQIGISENLLPDLFAGDNIIGHVTAEAAKITGLAVGTPVAVGVMDTVSAMVGAGVIHPGELLIIMGTVSRCCYRTVNPIFDDRMINAAFMSSSTWFSLAPSNGCGISMRWFKETFCEYETQYAKESGLSPYMLIDKASEEVSPGSNGLIYLPYLNGERSPVWDHSARGVFFGFSSSHKKAHFSRAIMEGVAYSIKQNLDIIEKIDGVNVKEVKLCGGCSSSYIWRKIIADVLGKTVRTVENTDTEALGSALIAAKGVGILIDYDEISTLVNLLPEIIEPDPKNTSIYNRYYKVYKNLYPILKDEYSHLYQFERMV